MLVNSIYLLCSAVRSALIFWQCLLIRILISSTLQYDVQGPMSTRFGASGVMVLPSAMIQRVGCRCFLGDRALARYIKPSLCVSGGLLLAAVEFVCLMLVKWHWRPCWFAGAGVRHKGVGIMRLMILGTDSGGQFGACRETGAASATSETAPSWAWANGHCGDRQHRHGGVSPADG